MTCFDDQTQPCTPSSDRFGDVVDRLLEVIRTASMATATDLYADGVVLDATVPGWRFVVSGDDAVRSEYARWFPVPGELSEVCRQPTPTGEVVEYFQTWTEDGVEHGAHHAHLLSIDRTNDRITEDHVFCGGRWPAPLLEQMSAPLFGRAS
jgi:hypothetical protein